MVDVFVWTVQVPLYGSGLVLRDDREGMRVESAPFNSSGDQTQVLDDAPEHRVWLLLLRRKRHLLNQHDLVPFPAPAGRFVARIVKNGVSFLSVCVASRYQDRSTESGRFVARIVKLGYGFFLFA